MKLIFHKDKTHNSVVAIKTEKEIIPITDRDLTMFVKSIQELRPDLIDDAGAIPNTIKELESKIEDLLEQINDLEEENSRLQDEIDEYEFRYDDED